MALSFPPMEDGTSYHDTDVAGGRPPARRMDYENALAFLDPLATIIETVRQRRLQ